MNWISKLEHEDKEKALAEKQSEEQAIQARQKEAARFQHVIFSLRPTLEKQIAAVARRLGVSLELAISDILLCVYAPKPADSILESPFPFWFELSQYDGSSLLVRAFCNHRIDRAGEPPDDMTYAEYYGTEEEVVHAHTTLDYLLSGDLDNLMEWLVACHRHNGSVSAPNLRTISLKVTQQKKNRGLQIQAALAFVLAAVGLLTLLPGLIACIWGLWIRHALKRTNQIEGRGVAGWAIGLGGLETTVLIILVIQGVIKL